MPLWTDIPQELTANHDPTIPVGTNTFAVNVSSGGSDVEGALVCLYKEGEVYARGYTDAFGDITLNLSPAPASLGTMHCTVTKNNYFPSEDSVEVISPSGGWVIFEGYTVIESSGNGDGNVDPGESIELPLTVHNVGSGEATGVSGIIRTEDSYVTVTDSSENFGDILADSLANSLDAFDFEVSSGCPANHVINFELIAADENDSTWISYFSVSVSTPDISFTPDTLNFDTVYIGYPDTLELLVNNNGTDTLKVSSITSGNMDYSVDISNFNILPDENQAVSVIFSPSSEGSSTGNLTIVSNDLDEPNSTVFLEGEGLEPPDISVSPDSLSDSLFTGETSTHWLTIYNTGGSNLVFEIMSETTEEHSTTNFASIRPIKNPSKHDTRLNSLNAMSPMKRLPGYDFNAKTTEGLFEEHRKINEGIPTNVGEVITSWPAPIGNPWGVGFDGSDVWLSDLSVIRDYQVTVDGELTGVDFACSWAGTWNGDFSWDGTYLWQVNVGGDNGIYQLDPATGSVINSIHDPDNIWDVSSQRGLAYDPSTDCFWVGGWNYSSIYLIKGLSWVNPGEIIRAIPFEGVSGLAWHPSGTLWIATNTSVDMIYEVDPASGEIIQSFEAPGEGDGYWGAGLEIDNNGDLWCLCQDNDYVYLVEGRPAIAWLSYEPDIDTVPPNDSIKIEVTFDATGLNGGDYYADVIIASNDPDEPEIIVPAHLHVTGVPDIAVSEDTLDYGIVFTGYSSTDTLIISNEGTDSLMVSNISSDNPDYTVDITNFNLDPGENQEVVVTFTPSATGTITGTLTITSNDMDEPTVTVSLLGECLEPPDISVSPDSLSDTLDQGQTAIHTLTIYNTGVADLVFDISIVGETILENPTPIVSSKTMQERSCNKESKQIPLVEIKKGEKDTRKYSLMKIGKGGPDGFGYRWEDSDEPDGPTFNWIDVSGGTSISLTDDDFETGIPLGFTFNYYGTDFTTIGVGSNGWLSFNGSDDWYPSNVPYVDSYEGAIAPFARDLYPPSASYIRYQTFGTAPNRYLVIEYNSIPDCCPSGDYKTFEVIFYETSNRIKFQYLTAPNDDPNGFGIESPDETMGMGNAGVDSLFISPAAVKDNYAIEFSLIPDWIGIDSVSGTISAADSTAVEITFDATDLEAGDYYAAITIASNDPDEPELVVPAHLHVPSSGIEEKIPKVFFVKQNYPNPFNRQTVIKYGCPEKAKVCIQVFDCLGRIVHTLIDKEVEAGYHEIKWDGSNKFGRKLSNSVYFYRIQAGDFMATKKMIFIR